jgi:hypothetical protein
MRLQRTQLGTRGTPTFGKLTSHDGKFFCYTLERPSDGEHPCIPAGKYHVIEDWHHSLDLDHRYRCPELVDVPGRTQIQLHIGNTIDDSEGCILVGERCGTDCVESSGEAFRGLMKYLKGAQLPFTLEVYDP